MLKLRYIREQTEYLVDMLMYNEHLIQITGEFPIKTAGFELSRLSGDVEGIENDKDFWDGWNYSAFTTVYREIDGGVQFSNDGSVYVEPEPEPMPEPEPYVPTLEEVQEMKVAEMNEIQQMVIQQGVDVTLADGTVEHFTLTDHDQTSLTGLQSQVMAGEKQIPWHTSDETEHCKFYTNANMALITTAAMSYVTWHVTYFRDLRIYIRSLDSKEAVEAVTYGMEIPEEFRSEPLKAMMAAQTE